MRCFSNLRPPARCRNRFAGLGPGFDTSSGAARTMGRILQLPFTHVLKSIKMEVVSKIRASDGSGLRVYLPGRPGETDCLREDREI
jgi:hypothetical protein